MSDTRPQEHDAEGPTRHPSPATWTEQRIRALGAVTDLQTAASILGLGRNSAYELVHKGLFPVPVIRAGGRYRVPVAPILAILHLAVPPPSQSAARQDQALT